MTEIMLFSLSNEKRNREWIEETFIKYVQTTARIICSPCSWWTGQELMCLANAARNVQVRYENDKDGEA